ncbi:MAG TPA: hypothetical protein VF215_15250, partial [Thermoanaerobaculia bacterium]
EQSRTGVAKMRALLASTARAEKAAVEADRRIQANADLQALYESADVVLLVEPKPSQAGGTNEFVFTFRVLRRFKDSGPESSSDAPFAYVRMSTVAHRRLYDRAFGSKRAVLFLRTVQKRDWRAVDAQQQLDNIDHRRFVPVESTVSVLHETSEIIAFLEQQSG